MVSTDSKRLYSFDMLLSGNFEFPDEGIVIPKKGLSELGKFLNNSHAVQIGVKNNHFIVKRDNETMMIKLLEGEYPDYRRVLSIAGFTSIHINRTVFMMMMKRMSILVSEDFKSVIFNFKENELVATITNPEIGESKEVIAIGYTGDYVESAFNPKYFIDALNAMKGDDVILNIKDNRNPCIIKGHDDKGFVCAIMAMSV
ncbi:MAG: DNA polymerase III subunit beta [Desulfamplus sp.]|nr:DNA polymerase III subunit beta [Desulfamplus sp.]